MIYPKSLCSVNRSIPVGQRRAVITRKDGKMYASTAIMPGDFLLADGSFSASTVFRQERGIFIGKDDKYIELFTLSDKAVTREEAFQYCLENRVSLPSLEELQIIDEPTARAVNNSLMQIGLKDSVLSSNVSDEFWSQDSLENQGNITKRRIMLVKKVIHLNKPSFPTLDGPVNCMKAFLPDVILVRQNFNDAFWVLQSIGTDYYYIMECQLLDFHSKYDFIDNGNIHLEGVSIVVEHPVGEVYFDNGCKYVNTHKDYYQRKFSSLYTKIGENHDRWQIKS